VSVLKIQFRFTLHRQLLMNTLKIQKRISSLHIVFADTSVDAVIYWLLIAWISSLQLLRHAKTMHTQNMSSSAMKYAKCIR